MTIKRTSEIFTRIGAPYYSRSVIMTATIAIWYSRREETHLKGRPPSIEMHINLWRHHKNNRNYTFLDVGIKIIDCQDLGSFNIYVPLCKKNVAIKDLSEVMYDDRTLGAVFNENLEATRRNEDGSFEVKSRGKDYVTIHPCICGKDFHIEDIADDEISKRGVLLKFKRDFCGSLCRAGEHYFRIRFVILNGEEDVFIEDTSSAEGFVQSHFVNSEVTEVRLNEFRSLPHDLIVRERAERWLIPEIKVLHYFLVRDVAFDLVASHANYRKIRRLEAGIWERYLAKDMPNSSARNMIIYHWRSGGEKPVSDVVTLAKFRRTKPNISIYILLVVLFGALGSAANALASKLLANLFSVDSLFLELSVLLVIALLAMFAISIVRRLASGCRSS